MKERTTFFTGAATLFLDLILFRTLATGFLAALTLRSTFFALFTLFAPTLRVDFGFAFAFNFDFLDFCLVLVFNFDFTAMTHILTW